MTIENLHNFLINYFEASQCEVNSEDETLDVKLTEEMDEQLMNRPFYWHYVKKLNQTGQPMELKLTTNFSKATKERDYIYFSTDRFKKIAQDSLAKGKFTKLYQKTNTKSQTPLYPWFVVNIKLSFLGNTHSEQIKSFGIHLINGTIIDQAFDWLSKKQWDIAIPDFCYSISPMINLDNGFKRIETYLINQLQNQEHQWANQSFRLLTEEIKLLDYFREKNPTMTDQHYDQERANLESIYHPKMKIDVINGGLFYIIQD